MEVKYKNQLYNIETAESNGMSCLVKNGINTGITGFAAGRNIFRVLLGGRWVNVYATEDESRYYAWLGGRQFVIEKPKEEEKAFGAEDITAGDRQSVYAPMPGSIVKVLVEPGQKVSEGEPLIIVEAMKMETSLYSSIDGFVTAVNARQGEQVNTDLVLVLIEKENNKS